MQEFEKLGSFYLGHQFDTSTGKASEDLLLYDSKDLTTHAVIIGMTGSGKTGLGIGLIEEALVDNIPVIAIDPKGDITNLLLSFPELAAKDFAPWVSQEEATRQGKSLEEFAAAQAEMWKQGLADSGQDAARIQKMRQSIDFAIYTPGSNAGLPVSVLRSFDAPSETERNDPDAMRERIQTTVSGLLGLLGIEADPIRSREHILLSNILASAWSGAQNLDLAGLIQQIQTPPFTKIGVMDLESMYPAKERFELAMGLNNLLASPGFATWMEGEPLEIKNMLFTSAGKPRCTIFYTAHLGDKERMFFVSQLLNQMLGWMRSQQGTQSLRAMLYMDEIFGYFPPNSNPASKTPMLTLLKQARAFGLGLVLSTQNPVDLDYKGLANAGTWFIGHLQTENDKARVKEALSGASNLDAGTLDKMLSGLGKRVFLMHDVHQAAPIAFQTRWTMSYLAGPMTLESIKRFGQTPAATSSSAQINSAPTAAAASTSGRPVLPPAVKQYFVPAKTETGVVYYPFVLGAAEAHYSSTKYKLDTAKTLRLLAEITDGPVPIDWDAAEHASLDLQSLQSEPLAPAEFADLPGPGNDAKNYSKWEKDFGKWVTQTQALVLLESKEHKLVSEPNESEQDFRARLTQSSRENKDDLVEKLRAKYAPKLAALQDKLARAEQNREQQAAQAQAQTIQAAVNVGAGILGALLGGGGRTRTRSAVTSVARAVRSGTKAASERGDVARADDTVDGVNQQIADLNIELENELKDLDTGSNPTEINLEEVKIKPKATDVNLELLALAWVPYVKNNGKLEPAY